MIDEEKQLENTQEPMTETPVGSQATGDEPPLSSDVNLPDLSDEGSDAPAMDELIDSPAGVDVDVVPGEGEDQPFEAVSAAEVGTLAKEVEVLKAQLEERTGQYMRIAADFDNFRKRTQREKEELEQKIKCSTIGELLPVVDNFERARSQIKPQTDAEMSIHKSYQSVYKQLVDGLKRIGVAPMRSEGKEFDPNLHEAVMRAPSDEHPEGTVIEELVRGYLLGERVLRHAMVKVSSGLETTASSGADDSGSGEG